MEGMVPILHVAGAQQSIDWYTQPGFQVEWQHAFEPGLPRYVALRRGPARLHLSEHRLVGGRPGTSTSTSKTWTVSSSQAQCPRTAHGAGARHG
jgi:glyoxalase superfamily protein